MASKKVQFVSELTSDKEWRDFIVKPGLIVIDLFSEWAGPCSAMYSAFKTLKVTSDVASEWMHLASAPVSIVPALKRFDDTSRPTFILLSGGRLVNVIFGCNAPRVIEVIKAEIEREIRAAKGQELRVTVSLSQLCPTEKHMQAARLAAEGDLALTELAREAMEAERVLKGILKQIADRLPDTTLVLVFPYALQADNCDAVLESLRDTWTEQGFSVTRETHMELTKDAVDLMFWERRLPQHDLLVESVTQGASLVLMLERLSETEEEQEEEEQEEAESVEMTCLEATIARTIYGFLPGTGSSVELVSRSSFKNSVLKEEDEGGDLLQGGTAPDESQIPSDAGVEKEKVEVLQEEEADDSDGATASPVDEKEHEGQQGVEEDGGEETETENDNVGTEDEEGEEGEASEENEEDEEGEQPDLGGTKQEVSHEFDGRRSGPGSSSRPDPGPGSGPRPGSGSPIRRWNPRELLPPLDSAAARLLLRPYDSGPALPGLWTPLTPLTKAAAVKALFPDMAEQLYEPPTPPPPAPPPTSVVFFNGEKRDEVLGVAANFATEVTRYGFFTKNRKLITSSRQDYEKLVRGGLQVTKTLLVLEVTRVRSAPLLELSTAGPQYISATPAIAKNDTEEFFGSLSSQATPADVREITKAMEQVSDEGEEQPTSDEPLQAGETEDQTGELAVDPEVPATALPEPEPDAEMAVPMPEAGEGSVAEVDGFHAVLPDIGEGDAPSTGGEGDAVAASPEE